MKRIISIIMVTLLTVVSAFANIAEGVSGDCQWVIDNDGNLTIYSESDEDVFISKYELQIPSKERMAEFLCFPCSNYSLCLCVRLSAFFICKILRKILRLLQFVLCICKNCFVYNYRLFFFEKYLVELTEIHNFAIKERKKLRKEP